MKPIYFYNEKTNTIIVRPKMKKRRNGVKVYFYTSKDESKETTLPIATADTPNGHKLVWVNKNFKISSVLIKRGRRWELAKKVSKIKKI